MFSNEEVLLNKTKGECVDLWLHVSTAQLISSDFYATSLHCGLKSKSGLNVALG